MASKNDGRFASLKALRHQRLNDEDSSVESEMIQDLPTTEVQSTDPVIEAQPSLSANRSATSLTNRQKEPKARGATEGQESQGSKRPGPGRPRGRRSNPDYTQITAYVPLELYLDIQEELTREKRELRKRSAINVSELIEGLLHDWLASRQAKNVK